MAGFAIWAASIAGSARAEAPAVSAAADQPIQSVDVGHRKLAYRAEGKGGPTVIIEAGFGLAAVESDEWNAVCTEIAKTNLTVRYDRAGLGASDPTTKTPRTSQDVARDLHTLLDNAKIPPPYVLVAHSIGGLHARVFADMFPKEVAGLVLVDVSHPDQDAKWLAALGKKRDGEDQAITQAREFLTRRTQKTADNPEKLDVGASNKQVRETKPLGDKPLAVVTHSRDWKMVPNLPDKTSKQLEAINQNLQAGLAKLSTNSSHVVAEHAGHHLHEEDPDLVVSAIREVIEKVNKSAAAK